MSSGPDAPSALAQPLAPPLTQPAAAADSSAPAEPQHVAETAAPKPAARRRLPGAAWVRRVVFAAPPAQPAAPVPQSQLPMSQRDPVQSVSWAVRAAGIWAACLLLVWAAIYVGAHLFEKVSLVAFAFVIGMFFTAVLLPVVNRLTSVGLHRTLATALVLVGGMAVFVLVGWFVVQQISSHASQLSDQVVQVSGRVTDWLKTGPLHLKDSDINSWQKRISDALKKNQGQLVSGALTTAKTLFEFISGFLLALFSTFFLLRDGEKVWSWTVRLFPRTVRERVDSAGHRGWQTLGGYVRGQVTIAFIHAITITILLLALRVPLAAALGVTIFLGSFVPIVGLTAAGTLSIGVTFLEHGATTAIIVAVVIIALVQAEGHLLQPLIMSRAVHIHPLAVVLSVTTGTLLYGIVGALIAVPLAAFGNSFMRGLWGEPRNSSAESPVPTDPGQAAQAHTDPPPSDATAEPA